jgi:hypothetical protein
MTSDPNEQFKMPLHEPLFNQFSRLKGWFREKLLQKRYDRVMSDHLLWLSISIAISSAIIETLSYFQTLLWPQKIPLFRYTELESSSLLPYWTILAIPTLSLLTAIIQFYIIKYLTIKRDKIQRYLLFSTSVITNLSLLLIYLYIKNKI